MWGKTMRALLIGALMALALAGSAQAKQIQQYFYAGESFETGDPSSGAIAVDGANQEILSVSKSDSAHGVKISKFNLNGDPAGFSGRGEATSFNTGVPFVSPPNLSIAIDESGGASDGNFYVNVLEGAANGESKTFGYDAAGEPLPGFPISIIGTCGLAVAPDGHLWLASTTIGAYGEFGADGNPTGRILSVGRQDAGCRIAIDQAGEPYVSKGLGRLAKYDAGLHFLSQLRRADPVVAVGGSTRLALDRTDGTLFQLFSSRFPPLSQVVQTDPAGNPLTSFGEADPAHFSYGGLGESARDVAVDPQTHKVYVLTGAGEVNVFERDPSVVTVPTPEASGVKDLSATSATLSGTVDPDGADTTDCHFEWGGTNQFGEFAGYDQSAPCAEGNVFGAASGANPVSAPIGGLSKGELYHFRLSAENANGVAEFSADDEFRAADPPILSDVGASHITTDSARVGLNVNTNGEDTGFHVEIGTDTSYGTIVPVPDTRVLATALEAPGFEHLMVVLTPQPKSQEVSGLEPETLYHYRVVAENAAGSVESADHVFRTYALPSSGDKCANLQARQQTSAGGLLDCRAYELVSAPDSGGYDVRSDLTPGVSALATSPQASDAALYSMRSGTIPGIAGHPTNRGADPYVARRGPSGWSTSYVGLPSNNSFATGPFASPLSGSDSSLSSFSFGGAEICEPCFEDGSTNAPLRLTDGSLVKGMAGSIDPGPAESAGVVKKPLSADGSHFVFGTTSQFEPAANSNGTDATIYSRDLKAGSTEVISADATGTAIANGDAVAELDVSKDGTRTVIGEKLSTDADGNAYYHLYLHIAGTAGSVDLMPGATQGALYDGMSADGSKVFFTSSEALAAGEIDTSADVYRDEVSGPGAVTPQILSQGSGGAGDTDACSPAGDPNSWNAVSGAGKCNVVAFAGGAGVASGSGDFYFLSPELLDGPSNGAQDQANLYLVSSGSSAPHFVATIDSSAVKPPPLPPTRPKLSSEFGGSHANPQAMAVDQSNGDVYVTEERSTLSRYTSAGDPKNFTEGPGEGTNSIGGLSFTEAAPGVAVDNSGGIFDGDIYVTNAPGVSVFSPSGKALGQLSGISEICGVAVDQSDGSVYVSDCAAQRISRFVPSAGTLPIENADYTVTSLSVGMEPDAVAADNGNVYSFPWVEGPVKQYKASEFEESSPSSSGVPLGVNAEALSTDPVTHEVYVDEGNQITTFNPAGEPQLTIGSGDLSHSRGVAVNATSHHIYAAASPAGKVIEYGYHVIPYEPIDNPAIVHGVKQAGTYDSADFEITPDGKYAAFASLLPIDGYDSNGHYEAFRYGAEAGSTPQCVSCSVTLSTPQTDAGLTPYGSSLSDDGRVFFTTGEQLTLRDANEKRDAYEWEGGKQELISTGTDSADSELLSASSNGKDAFFFTRQKLVPEDENANNLRLYDAREGGGFEFGPPQFSCAASDECHGASTAPAPPLGAGTTAGTPGQFSEEAKAKCRKGKVKRKGKCVARHAHKRHNHKRAAKTNKGGGK
jgi:hypothetical protein